MSESGEKTPERTPAPNDARPVKIVSTATPNAKIVELLKSNRNAPPTPDQTTAPTALLAAFQRANFNRRFVGRQGARDVGTNVKNARSGDDLIKRERGAPG